MLSHMTLPTIFVGSEANAWHAVLDWAAGEPFETIDGSETLALETALGATLFAETRNIHVPNAQVVELAWWGRGVGTVHACGSIISQEGAHTKQSRALAKNTNIVLCDRRWVIKTIGDIFKSRGVGLETKARQMIESGCEGNVSRVRSVATICNMAGITHLSPRVAVQLLGSVRSEAKVWEACDHLLDGRILEAAGVAEQSEDVPLAANLSETLRTLLVLREGGTIDGMHPYVQKRRAGQAHKYDVQALTSALQAATECEHMIRSGDINARAAIVRVHIALRRTVCT